MSLQELSTQNLFTVKDKIALVTGGGSGIGKMIAAAFVANGARVYIAARKEGQLKAAAEELNEAGPGTCEYIVADLSSKAGCQALISTFKSREQKLHILVNNSGVAWGAPYDDFPEKEGWDRVLAVNVKSIFYSAYSCPSLRLLHFVFMWGALTSIWIGLNVVFRSAATQGLTDYLAKDATSFDPGRVINISSTAALDPHAEDTSLANKGNGLWSYNTSKAAANHLTSLLAVTLCPKHITVNAILPGVFPSKMTAFGFRRTGEDKMASAQPSGRVGSPTDMAGLALFLCSPASAYVTGNHIVIDGGSVLVRTKASFQDVSASPTPAASKL
ncbi:hypothetical protein ACEPAF_3099 [Sanghuangporus sanghuang]